MSNTTNVQGNWAAASCLQLKTTSGRRLQLTGLLGEFMRTYEKVKETVERERLVQTTCDLCGAIAKHGNWESSCYEVAEVEVEVTVRQRDGSSYPEGGWGTELKVDMCPKCFKETLIPFLRSKGATIEEREWGF